MFNGYTAFKMYWKLFSGTAGIQTIQTCSLMAPQSLTLQETTLPAESTRAALTSYIQPPSSLFVNEWVFLVFTGTGNSRRLTSSMLGLQSEGAASHVTCTAPVSNRLHLFPKPQRKWFINWYKREVNHHYCQLRSEVSNLQLSTHAKCCHCILVRSAGPTQ